MPNIANVLREEITRLSRREIKKMTAGLQRSSAAHRRDLAALKRQIAALERTIKQSSRQSPRAETEAEETGGKPMRFVAKGLRSLRHRLGLSAPQFGTLVGASGQSVYNWESKKAVPRRSQLAVIASVRGISKGEAMARISAKSAPAKKVARKKGRKAR